jgi:hypothetical protein
VRGSTEPDSRAATQTQIARREICEQGRLASMDETHLSAAGAQLISVNLEENLRGIEQR